MNEIRSLFGKLRIFFLGGVFPGCPSMIRLSLDHLCCFSVKLPSNLGVRREAGVTLFAMRSELCAVS